MVREKVGAKVWARVGLVKEVDTVNGNMEFVEVVPLVVTVSANTDYNYRTKNHHNLTLLFLNQIDFLS